MYECLVKSEVFLGEKSHVMVVLGWFNIKSFKKIVEPKLYGVAGSLFNGEMGSEILISNLLFNPQITDIVLCNITCADGWVNYPCKQFLKKLDRYEKESESNVLTKSINFYSVETEEGLLDCLMCIPNPVSSISRRKVVRPIQLLSPSMKPSQFNGQTITAKNLDDAHLEVVKRILEGGKDTNEDKAIREILNLTVVLTNLPTTYDDLLDSCGELNQLYIDQFINGTGDSHNYGYGDRLNTYFFINQPDNIALKLTRKPDSLAALMVLWDVRKDLLEGSSPCLTQIWVRLIDKKLHMSAVFRSNDMFKAWKANVQGLRGLQIKLSDRLGVVAGDLTTFSMSSHIYHQDFEFIQQVIGDHKTPRKEFYSCVGNFTIGVRLDGIEIIHTDNSGSFVDKYSGIKSARILLKKIVENNPTIENNHLLYLADELYSAESCFDSRCVYKQS